MAKPAGSACNLNCSYCYYLEKKELYSQTKSFIMNDNTLEEYVEGYINAAVEPEVLFTWHGGETLLRGLPFFKKALALQKKYSHGKRISNSLQTNGTLLTDEWCAFFKDNDFLIGISIDGPEHCHDIYRKSTSGKGTFQKVMRGIELLKKHNVEFNTLSVINNYNVEYPLEVYRFLRDMGSGYIQFTPIVERITRDDAAALHLLSPDDKSNYILAPWNVDPVKFGKFYIEIFDEWVKRDVGTCFVQLFDSTLANTVGVPPSSCVYAEECGHAAVMEFNGDVYSCDHYVFPEYKLGNIHRNTIVEMMFSEKQRQFGLNKSRLPQKCLNCDVEYLCHGECPKNRIVKTGQGEPHLNYLCDGYKMIFKHMKPYMDFMAEELRNDRPPSNVMDWRK